MNIEPEYATVGASLSHLVVGLSNQYNLYSHEAQGANHAQTREAGVNAGVKVTVVSGQSNLLHADPALLLGLRDAPALRNSVLLRKSCEGVFNLLPEHCLRPFTPAQANHTDSQSHSQSHSQGGVSNDGGGSRVDGGWDVKDFKKSNTVSGAAGTSNASDQTLTKEFHGSVPTPPEEVQRFVVVPYAVGELLYRRYDIQASVIPPGVYKR